MKKTLMCATAAAAFASAGFVAHAEDGWYARADATFGFDGKLDHDPAEQDVIGTMGSGTTQRQGAEGEEGGTGLNGEAKRL